MQSKKNHSQPTYTTPANLFTAAKSYALAMNMIFSRDIISTALSAPYYLLAGFSLELSFKSIVLLKGNDESEIRKLGHDLNQCHKLAIQRGYVPANGELLSHMVGLMAAAHKNLELRYIPDKTEIQLPKPDILRKVIGKHLDAIEEQFPIWPKDMDAP